MTVVNTRGLFSHVFPSFFIQEFWKRIFDLEHPVTSFQRRRRDITTKKIHFYKNVDSHIRLG